MAHGKNSADKSNKRGKEWWGRKPLRYYPVSLRSKTNKWFKRLLHKKERVLGKKQIPKYYSHQKPCGAITKDIHPCDHIDKPGYYGCGNCELGVLTKMHF